jgi:hypothetical protein
MSLLFKNKREQGQASQHAFQDRMAVAFVRKCIQAQLKWANYMQRRSDKLSASAKKYCLVLCCLLSVGCSLYLILKNFSSSNDKALMVAPINVPLHSTNAGDHNTYSPLLITKAEFQRIERFRRYMDSLNSSVSGKRVRDSILLSRPQLMDSIQVLERLFQLQNSK